MHDIFSQIFNQELKQLGSDLQSMAAQVATAIERASESLRNGDLIVAEQVIDADERINDLQRDIDDMCVMLLARQQPVADNLRTVISALRMAQTLERQGDLARHLATIARGRYPEPPVRSEETRLNSSHPVISYAVFCLKKKRRREIGRAHV